MKVRAFGFLASLSLIVGMFVPIVPLAAQEKLTPLIINRIKLGGAVVGEPTEYVEIYNQSADEVNLSGWTLEYAKPSAKISDCNAKNWKLQDISANVRITELAGTIGVAASAIVEFAMNDNVGGSLRLSNSTDAIDVVGWGNESSKGVCKEQDYAPIPASTKTIWRVVDTELKPQDTNNNKADFTDTEQVIGGPGESIIDICPNLVGEQAEIPYGYELVDGECAPVVVLPAEACVGVSLSEILPNPAGIDTGAEYVELFNGTDAPVSLLGCSIRVGNTTKNLSGVILPGYTAIYGIILPNAAGAAVEFITPTTEEAVTYPGGLGDNIAWAFVNGIWQETNRPTPNGANVISIAEVEASSNNRESLGACPPGKYRNPATNRCKSLTVTGGLRPCEPGQYRNPETNRCKSTASAITSLKPCSPGQIRNPATNRCKKAAGAAGLKPCADGQERNPETNRCRKVAGASTTTPSSESDQAVDTKRSVSFAVLGVIAALALAYGIYEYRTSIANFFSRIRKN